MWILCILFVFTTPVLFAKDQPDVTVSTLLKRAVNVEHLYQPGDGFPRIWSSYDRTGGGWDDQGYIRKEQDQYVIAEMMGPGAITRIWAAGPSGKLSFFIDGGSKPLFTIAAKDLFTGKLPPFTGKWIHQSKSGGGFSFVPIPYDQFCKIVATDLFAYEIDYTTYSSETKVEPFTLPLASTHRTTQAAISKTLNTLGQPPFKMDQSFVEDPYPINVLAAESVNFATFTGPAVIRGIQIQWDKQDINFGRDLVLEIYWDHHAKPAVRVPLFDFFGGRGKTWLIGTNENNEGYCFLPMPFHEQARLVLRNDNLEKDIAVHVTVYYQKVASLPKPLPRFHALWHYNTTPQKATPVPFDMQRMTPLSNTAQNEILFQSFATGFLAGMTLSQYTHSQADLTIKTAAGMRTLDLHGNSVNSFLNAGRDPMEYSHPFSASAQPLKGYTSFIRVFLPMPFSFEQFTQLTKENGHASMNPSPSPIVVYWYQENQPQSNAVLSPYKARHFQQTPNRKQYYKLDSDRLLPIPVMEAESAKITANGGAFEPQDMTAYGLNWSQNQQLCFDAFQQGAELDIRLPDIEYSGWYRLHGVFTQSPDSGIISLSLLDNRIEDRLDLYADSIQALSYQSPSSFFFHAGEPVIITIQVEGQNEKANELKVGIDYLELQAVQTIPNQISHSFPFFKEKTGANTDLQFHSAGGNTDTPVGFSSKVSQQTLRPKTIGKTPSFILPKKKTDANHAHTFITFEIQAGQDGIYRMDLVSGNPPPFIFSLRDTRLLAEPDRIWVNGIPLRANETRFWDMESQSLMPMRFSVPLQKGTNQISWLMNMDETVSFTPIIYGLTK